MEAVGCLVKGPSFHLAGTDRAKEVCMHVFENVPVCICTCAYRQACRQWMMLEEYTKEKMSRQHLRMSEARWEKV